MRDVREGPFVRVERPTMTYTEFDRPRSVSDWVNGGNADEGCEANGTVLRYDVIEALNRAQRDRQPCEYVVIGERRFSDGRHFLDFAINPRWVEETTNYRKRNDRWVWVCPECDGINDDHRKIQLAGSITAKCPRDMRPSRRSA